MFLTLDAKLRKRELRPLELRLLNFLFSVRDFPNERLDTLEALEDLVLPIASLRLSAGLCERSSRERI